MKEQPPERPENVSQARWNKYLHETLICKVMDEFEAGTLKFCGATVTDREKACKIALHKAQSAYPIALSEARPAGKKT